MSVMTSTLETPRKGSPTKLNKTTEDSMQVDSPNTKPLKKKKAKHAIAKAAKLETNAQKVPLTPKPKKIEKLAPKVAKAVQEPAKESPAKDPKTPKKSEKALKQPKTSSEAQSPIPASESFLSWCPLGDRSTSDVPVIFNPDYSFAFLAVGTTVKIYSTHDASLLSTLTPPVLSSAFADRAPATVSSVLLHPSNALQLVVTSKDGMIRIWDYTQGVLLRTLDVGTPVLHACANSSLPDSIFVSLLASTASFGEESRLAGVYLIGLKPAPSKEGATAPSFPRTPSRRVRLAQPRLVQRLIISPDGQYLVSMTDFTIYIARTAFVLERGFEQSLEAEKELSCIAFHPNENYFATGDISGKIRLWYGAFEFKEDSAELNVQTSILHWHAQRVLSLTFTPNGAYLLSGGQESVVVLWQLHSGHKEFIPRLGGPAIDALTTTNSQHKEQEIVARLADGSVVFVGFQKLTITKTIESLKIDPSRINRWISKEERERNYPLAIQPFSNSLVMLSSHPTSLQFYSPAQDKETIELEVAPSNRITTANLKIEPTRVERVVFSNPLLKGRQRGDYWMATLDSWKSGNFSAQVNLKFWKYEFSEARFSLTTRISAPHETKVTSFSFTPSASLNPLLLTTSEDGAIKIWIPEVDTWRCRSSLSYRSNKAVDSDWSSDGSMFAVAHEKVVTLWTLSDGKLLHTFACGELGKLESVSFVGAEGTTLIAAGKLGTKAWDLLSFEEQLSFPTSLGTMNTRPGKSTTFLTESSKKSKNEVFFLNATTQSITRNQLPFAIKNAVFLDPMFSNVQETDTALAAITATGDVVLVGDTAITSFAKSQAMSLPAATTGHSNIFDELFGIDTEEAEPVAAGEENLLLHRIDKGASKGLEVLEGNSHTLPPVRLLWRDVMESFSTAVSAPIEPSQEEIEDDAKMETEVVPTPIGEVVYSSLDPLIDLFKTRLSTSSK